jgi:hypothetical protein
VVLCLGMSILDSTIVNVGDPLGRKRMFISGLIVLTGASIGLLAGGALTEAISWHWIFFVNEPSGSPPSWSRCVCWLGFTPRLVTRFGARAALLPGLSLIVAGLGRCQRVPIAGDYVRDVLLVWPRA